MNIKELDRVMRVVSDTLTESDLNTKEAMLVLINMACVIAHETCAPKELLSEMLDHAYTYIGGTAEDNTLQ